MSLIIKNNNNILVRDDVALDLRQGSAVSFTITNPDSFAYSNVGAYLVVSGYVNEEFKDKTPDEMLNQVLSVAGEISGLFIRINATEGWTRFTMNSGSGYENRIPLYSSIAANESVPFQLKFVDGNNLDDVLFYVGLTVEGTYA